ncbi:exosome complex exonuclease RRP44-like isoform X2 [Corticium candelabrum]|uniref:exosome complex exonuclease RRP44-like isoform X2 n=1 Tax=Corticium candelabrum TaxID=121492 RepID=UPI002E25DE5E|nr:exosome complex exonuclease RRP44-like isoform X2 [Corticium candelabrum]
MGAHLSLSAFHENLKTGSVFQGTFHTQRDNPFEGHVTVSVLNGQVLIHGAAHVNRAVDGDVVGIELLPENEWSTPSDSTVLPEDEAAENEETERDDSSGIENPTSDKIRAKLDCSRKPSGRIVAIVKRNWRPYCGTLLPTNMKTSVRRLFVPMDRKIPRIVIETRQGDALDRKRIVVSIDSWPRTCRSPCGHFVRVLGDVGDKETENEVLLLEHDVPHQPFPQIVLSDLPAVPWIISDEEAKKRTDLRHLCICSVDPPGCTDIDDALHCQMLENGNYEVGVHIADVSHFVRPGTALDKEAANRGTTVYLVDKRVDMVPELLSSNLCSLRPNEDRFAMSCVWEIKPTAEIIHTQYLKSIIRSQHAFTYAEAQLRIDDKHKNDEVTKSLRSLNAMAKILKQRRVDKGALLLASPEVKFTLDDATHDPIDLEAKQLRETNSMVEEFMLLANVSVAERISREFPVCAVLRRHPQPAPSNFEPLIKAASLKGITLEVDSGKALSNSLAQAVLPGNDYFCTLIRILATRCMTQALYFCSGTEPESEYFHYGLAADIYTHYTSPIRRYADIMVHRLLATAIAADTTHPEMIDSRRVQEVCNHLNKRHRMGQYAGRASIQLSAQLFFKGKNVTENGYITSVRKNAVYVLIPKYGIELPLFLDQPSFSPPFVYNERAPSQVSGSVCLCTFDRVVVSVTLEEQDHMPGRLKLQLVEPKVHGAAVLNSDGQSLRKKRKVSST